MAEYKRYLFFLHIPCMIIQCSTTINPFGFLKYCPKNKKCLKICSKPYIKHVSMMDTISQTLQACMQRIMQYFSVNVNAFVKENHQVVGVSKLPTIST